MRTRYLFAFLLIASCTKLEDPKQTLGVEKYNVLLTKLSPYVIKKPDNISYEERFDSKNFSFYANFNKLTGGHLAYYQEKDTANFFFYAHRDLSSLYEHYRGLGGYFKQDRNGNIVFLDLLYHTPRFTNEEMEKKGRDLFMEMITEGHVDKYVGNRQYIHTPNADFYYDTKRNRWDYTENSSWKFLDEAQKADTVRNGNQ